MDDILLIQFLRNASNRQFDGIDINAYPWETLIRQSRRTNLISRVAKILEENHILEKLPHSPRQHFKNAITLATANARSARLEANEVYQYLHKNKIDCVLLKGAAYVYLGNRASLGRLFSDTDIMVHPKQLLEAEKVLVHSGWTPETLDVHDQKYYRQWMHEIPPLRHMKRQTSLDVHHSIIPPISPEKLDAEKLWENLSPVTDKPGLYTFAPMDMILHSATHLFHEGEFKQGLRDISDLDLLINEYITTENDWSVLLERSRALNLELSLYYALNFCSKILHSPIPPPVLEQIADMAKVGKISQYLMDLLFLRALIPDHSTYNVTGSQVSQFLLFVRSHWIKMPWYILIPHLSRKGWLQLLGKRTH